MRIDLVVANEGPFALEAVKTAPEIEAMGYDGIWLTDHVIGVDVYTAYGPTWLEILTTLGWIAAATKRIRLGTGVLILPYRNPVLTAKMLATIDQLSGGRVDLGVGTGWAEPEFVALGVASAKKARGTVTNETLDVMLRCWQGGEFEWKGRHFEFGKIGFEPVPVQQPRIPIWVGARGIHVDAPLKRAAKYADWWHPTGMTPAELKAGGERLDEMAGRRVPRSIRFRVPAGEDAGKVVEWLGAYREAGCEAAAVDLKAGEVGEFLAGAERLAKALA